MEDGHRRFTVDVEFPSPSDRDALAWSGQLVLHLDVAGGMLAVEGVSLDGTGKICFTEEEAALCFPLSSTLFSASGAEGDESVALSGMCDAGVQVHSDAPHT